MRTTIKLLLTVLTLFFIAGILLYFWLGPKPRCLPHKIAESETSSFSPVVGYAGHRFVAALSTEGETLVYLLDNAGKPEKYYRIPNLWVEQILSREEGLLLVGGDRFMPLDADGMPLPDGPVVRLVNAPVGLSRTFSLDENILAVLAMESGEPTGESPGEVHFRAYRLDGTPIGPGTTIHAKSPYLYKGGLVRLSGGDYLLSWTDKNRLFVARVAKNGDIIDSPKALYAAKLGGVISDCRSSGTAEGNALIVWSDSSPGSWEVFAIQVGSKGPLGPALQVSPGFQDEEGLSPRVLFDGQRNYIAWRSGIRWGLFARIGSGKISVRDPEMSPIAVYDTSGSIEDFEMAIHKDLMAITAVSEKGEKYEIYSGVFSTAPR